MSRLKVPCLDCGYLSSYGPRCYLCARSRRHRAYGADYQRRRLVVIGGPCELRLDDRCTGIADTADHVVPVARGGQDGPLRGACLHCNSRRQDRDVPRVGGAIANVSGAARLRSGSLE